MQEAILQCRERRKFVAAQLNARFTSANTNMRSAFFDSRLNVIVRSR